MIMDASTGVRRNRPATASGSTDNTEKWPPNSTTLNVVRRRLCPQARGTEAILGCPGLRHGQPGRFGGAPAVAAEPTVEGDAAARASELARRGLAGARFHG